MPQMFPLNWLFLFLYFTYIFMFINIIMYYSFNYSIIKFYKTMNKSKINWKW